MGLRSDHSVVACPRPCPSLDSSVPEAVVAGSCTQTLTPPDLVASTPLPLSRETSTTRPSCRFPHHVSLSCYLRYTRLAKVSLQVRSKSQKAISRMGELPRVCRSRMGWAQASLSVDYVMCTVYIEVAKVRARGELYEVWCLGEKVRVFFPFSWRRVSHQETREYSGWAAASRAGSQRWSCLPLVPADSLVSTSAPSLARFAFPFACRWQARSPVFKQSGGSQRGARSRLQ